MHNSTVDTADIDFALSFVGIDAELWARPWAAPESESPATSPTSGFLTSRHDLFPCSILRIVSGSITQD